jgi:hypothetical protein
MFRLPKLEPKIKRTIIIWLAWISIVLLAYVYGSFSPNRFVERKIIRVTENQMIEKAKLYGFHQPDFHYNDSKSFVFATQKCVSYLNLMVDPSERVPVSIIVAMAIVESNYGTSRFAQEGNALFGVRTWNMKQPHMKPLGIPNARFGVKKYTHKCESVSDMIRILNTHPAYKEFRTERDNQMYSARNWNYEKLLNGIKAWSINVEYTSIILNTIKEHNLP